MRGEELNLAGNPKYCNVGLFRSKLFGPVQVATVSTQQLASGEVIFERPWGPFLEHSMRSPPGETMSRLLLILSTGSGSTTPVCNVAK